MFFFPNHSAGKERDFFSSNWGYSGLIEIPDARVMEKEMWRPHIRQAHPYRFYSVSFTPFEGIEITGRVTEILGVKASESDPRWKGYGNYKDKALDGKLRIIKEDKYLPQVLIGIMDPHGTRLYPSQYVVLSKKFYPLDITLGLGNGRFGKRPLSTKGEGFYIEMLQDPKKWLEESQIFWGVRFYVSERLNFVLEYDPTRYHRQIGDPARIRYFYEKPKSKLNLGLVATPYRWMDLTFTYERGKTVGFGISAPFEIGNPLLPISVKPYREAPNVKEKPLEERIRVCLFEIGFIDIGVRIEGATIFIDVENNTYFYLPKALHMIATNIYPLLPPHVENVIIVFKESGLPVLQVETKRDDIGFYLRNEINLFDFISICKVSTPSLIQEGEKFAQRRLTFRYKPQISFYVNDPSGFWKWKAGIVGWGDYKLNDLMSFKFAFSAYPVRNISSTVGPLSIPVRSDIVDYLKRPLWPDTVALNLVGKTETDLYYRFTGGYLDYEYGGLDAEIAKVYGDGRLFLGFSGSLVKKRDPNTAFLFRSGDVKDYYAPFFGNLRLNIPEFDTHVDLKVGRFLAGDVGVRIGISKWIKGVTLSAWMGITDTSIFKDKYNRNYRDKGISVMIPMRIFEGKESRSVYGYTISPWTRDVAQDVIHPDSLFDRIGRNVKKMLDRDAELFYKER